MEDCVGIHNPGKIGYLTSILQVWFHITAFRKRVYAAGIGLEQSSTLYEVQRLFYEMQSFDANLLTGLKKRKEGEHSKKKKVKFTRARTVFPARLLHSFGWDTASQWDLQDAHEMATVFLDALNRYGSFGSMFMGQSLQTIYSAPVTRLQTASFNYIFLSTKGLSGVVEALESLTQAELLDGDNSYYMDGVKQPRATIRHSFHELPDVLQLYVKRYEFNYDTMHQVKERRYFEFPEILDMLPYVEPDSVDMTQGKSLKYRLYALVVHEGNASRGLYSAYCRPQPNGSWIKFKNEQVYTVPTKEVMSCQDAYLLFYLRETRIDELLAPLRGDEGLAPDRVRCLKEDLIVSRLRERKTKLLSNALQGLPSGEPYQALFMNISVISEDNLFRYHQVPYFGLYNPNVHKGVTSFPFSIEWDPDTLRRILIRLTQFGDSENQSEFVTFTCIGEANGTIRQLGPALFLPSSTEAHAAITRTTTTLTPGDITLLLFDWTRLQGKGLVQSELPKRFVFVKQYDPRGAQLQYKGTVLLDADVTVEECLRGFLFPWNQRQEGRELKPEQVDVFMELSADSVVKVGWADKDLPDGTIIVFQETISEPEQTAWTGLSEDIRGYKTQLATIPGFYTYAKSVWTYMPEELWLSVFDYLDGKTLANASMVCKRWQEIMAYEQLWTKNFEADFGDLPATLPEGKTIRTLYQEASQQMSSWKGELLPTLYWATKNGYVKVLRRTPIYRTDDKNRYLLLLKAAKKGQLASVKYLATFLQTLYDGLSKAAKNGHVEVVRWMLCSGKANPNQIYRTVPPPLYEACRKGHVKVVEALLTSPEEKMKFFDDEKDRGITLSPLSFPAAARTDITGPGSDGALTPLFVAVKYGHLEVVKVLVEKAKVSLSENQNVKGGIVNFALRHQPENSALIDYLLNQPSQRKAT